MSTSGDAGVFQTPEWFTKARALFTSSAAVAGGVALWEDPSRFVLALVAEWVVNGVLMLFAKLAEIMILVQRDVFGALGKAGGALLDASGVLGDLVLAGLDAVEAEVVELAASAGPLAPLVVVGAWVLMAAIGAATVRGIIEVIRVAW